MTRVTPVAKGPVEALLTSLNLGPQQGLDPEPENIVAVGTFTSTPPGQPPQQVTSILHLCCDKGWVTVLLGSDSESTLGQILNRLVFCCMFTPISRVALLDWVSNRVTGMRHYKVPRRANINVGLVFAWHFISLARPR